MILAGYRLDTKSLRNDPTIITALGSYLRCIQEHSMNKLNGRQTQRPLAAKQGDCRETAFLLMFQALSCLVSQLGKCRWPHTHWFQMSQLSKIHSSMHIKSKKQYDGCKDQEEVNNETLQVAQKENNFHLKSHSSQSSQGRAIEPSPYSKIADLLGLGASKSGLTPLISPCSI